MCWQARTSLRWKCSRGGAWRRIMCCSSFIWATGGYRSLESRIIPTLWRMAMEQMARNATLEELGCLHPSRYLLHDRDTKFCESFREVLKAVGVKATEV